MSTEPTITFLDLARAIGADPAHERTIPDNLKALCRELGKFPLGSLGWNAYENCKRRVGEEDYPDYLLDAAESDVTSDLADKFATITPARIIEILNDLKWPAAGRAWGLLQDGSEDAAVRFLVEAGVPNNNPLARLFVESLALTASEAWLFCERNCLPVPEVLRQMLAGRAPMPKVPEETGGKTSQPQSTQRRRGRRPTYDWSAFHAEIARRVGKDPDGYPTVQADLERAMTEWCIATWGEDECPSESTIREQVTKHYQQGQ